MNTATIRREIRQRRMVIWQKAIDERRALQAWNRQATGDPEVGFVGHEILSNAGRTDYFEDGADAIAPEGFIAQDVIEGRLEQWNTFETIEIGAYRPPLSEDEPRGRIYLVVNALTRECYIGETEKPLTERQAQHMRSKDGVQFHVELQAAPHVFKWYTLEDGIPQSQLKSREARWIAVFDAYENGYNSTAGFFGKAFPTTTPEQKARARRKKRAILKSLGY